jgi:tRNA dimethylallyltransferase
VPEDVRAQVREASQGRSPQELHAELAAKDPETAARLRPTDPQRILRALEVFAATGKPLASFHGPRRVSRLDAARCPAFFLAPTRETLYARIDARFDKMMESGALDEVARLAERRLDPALPAMRAHGVPGLIAYLEGRATLDEAVMRGKLDTRHYAKRQFTFARSQLPHFAWLSGAETVAEVEAACRVLGC